MKNRLSEESSPYLRQHETNPVAWQVWGREAFDLAKELDRPIFLSVGYSTCHWCHVMAHESFEHEDVAKLLNTLFVPIKVDREERPDVDALYMQTTQMLTGRGGWPNSVFLTPDQEPFFAGTYWPRDDSLRQTGFLSILERVSEEWTSKDRSRVMEQAGRLADALKRMEWRFPTEQQHAQADLKELVLHTLVGEADLEEGGFGDAPKFPPHAQLGFLLDRLEEGVNPVADQIVRRTLDVMAQSGLRDHVGSGFHRYATDANWFLPHFEKMLTDQAQLIVLYSRAAATLGTEAYRKVAEHTCDFVLDRMTAPDGTFYSAFDADSEGDEGRFYLWAWADLERALGTRLPEFAELFGLREAGNAHDEATGRPTGLNHLAGNNREALGSDIHATLNDLSAYRDEHRLAPGLDTKVLTSWNGMMISALAHCAAVSNDPRYLAAAERCSEAILKFRRREDGGLWRSTAEGFPSVAGVLEDYSFLAKGLIDLSRQSKRSAEWLQAAGDVLEEMDVRFADGTGGLWLVDKNEDPLLVPMRDPFDNAIPSPAGIASLAFQEFGTPETRMRADEIVASFAGILVRAPEACLSLLRCALHQ